jgi:TolB-like protein/tetratricopeptide (TPR) repeat protein/predicted Ser/Thr protein kinase
MPPSPRSTGAGPLPAGRWARVKEVFLGAIDLAEPDRSAFVEKACEGDAALAREVHSLLERDRLAASFCERPAAELLRAATVTNPNAFSLSPGAHLGAYEITGFIGAGGMGQVYRARDTRLGREVAIKTVPAQGADNDAQRLIREARHTSKLQHPNICTIYETGEAGGIPFIAMELVRGRMLSELPHDTPRRTDDTLRCGIAIADALDHAHSRGIVHRDLKSSNVMVGDDGRVVVLDFGLAARVPVAGELSDSLTASQPGLAGTLTHMAPEVLLGGRGDARSDIWSLGVLLYHLVNRQLPFNGRTAFETSSAIMAERPKPMDAGVPMALRLVIERCLAKDPAERYQRASDVRAALQAIQERRGWRIAAGLMRPSRRRWMQVAAAAILGAAALAGGRALVQLGADLPARSFGTLAVLPVEIADGDGREDFFASGLTDALIAQLGAAGNLRVISRTSVMHAHDGRRSTPDMARDLGADAIVAGRVQRSGDRVRLDLQVLDAARDTVVWSDSFERSARDVLVLQADAVRAVAGAVRAALRPGADERLTVVPAIRPEVYEAYLKGRYEWNRRTRESLTTAMQYFRQAVALDPTFAPAHAALADCYNQLGTVLVGAGSPRDHRPNAEREAIQALQIDPSSSEAHAALGYVRHYQRRWAESEDAFLRAIDLNPSNTLARLWYANLLMSRRRFDESLRQAYAAHDLDPFSLIVNTNIGWILTFAGQHAAAVEQLTRTVALGPTYPQARWRLADVLMLMGRYDEAHAQLTEALRVTDRSPSTLSMAAVLSAGMGRRDEALAFRRELLSLAGERYVPPSSLAAVYQAFGETDAALDWMERSFEEGSNWIAYLAVDPWTEPLRDHPRFQSLLRRAGHQ